MKQDNAEIIRRGNIFSDERRNHLEIRKNGKLIDIVPNMIINNGRLSIIRDLFGNSIFNNSDLSVSYCGDVDDAITEDNNVIGNISSFGIIYDNNIDPLSVPVVRRSYNETNSDKYIKFSNGEIFKDIDNAILSNSNDGFYCVSITTTLNYSDFDNDGNDDSIIPINRIVFFRDTSRGKIPMIIMNTSIKTFESGDTFEFIHKSYF